MDIPPLPPSEAINPALTDERLAAIVRAIAQGRLDKLALRKPADVPWNLNCDCYIWAWWALRETTTGPMGEWLFMPGKHGDLDALFYIGGPPGVGVPARFYRADSPSQPARASRATQEEKAFSDPDQFALFVMDFEEASPAPTPIETPPVVRFALKVGSDLALSGVELQLLTADERVVYAWPIPMPDLGILPLMQGTLSQGVELPPAEAELPEDKAAREERERKEKERKDKDRGA